MRLPPLSLIIGTQAVVWCFAGVYVHGWRILLYPLFWAVIVAVFFGVDRLISGTKPAAFEPEVRRKREVAEKSPQQVAVSQHAVVTE